jgi:transcriptional regulator with XRE-family HTH domain
MNDDDHDRLISELVAKPLERERILDAAELSNEERRSILAACDAADLLWLSARGAPPLPEDPIAAMLGLVPDDDCRLDSAALRRVRKRASLKVSDVAERLQARGWAFDSGDVFRWETRSAADVAPAVVQAIADILGEPVESLIAARNPDSHDDELAAVRRHPLFERLVDRWMRVQHVSRAVAIAALETRMLATVHRGERPDPEQLLHSLEALVASLESSDE